MGWARDLTGDYQRGLLSLAIPSIVAAGLIWALGQRSAEAKPAFAREL
jgi:hypothetical protein